jgi:pilus assembly protein CpaE
MLQIFGRSTRKAKRILTIGCVTPDPQMGAQFKAFVAERDGVDLTLITSSAVTASSPRPQVSVFVYDLDVTAEASIREFDRFMECRPKDIPVIVLSPAVGEELVRWFLRLKVSDWIKTPLTPGELIAACGRVISHAEDSAVETRCLTFMGARGGVGATTVALHAALGLAAKAAPAVTACVVDLDLISGSCADYLDLKSNWQIDELASDPARLDQHMLDTMVATHAGGIAVLSTRRPFADRLNFSEEVVTRSMDLAAQKYETLVVDLPRHAESWSQGVLQGSSQVYVVTDLTIPGLKSARRMIDEISTRFGGDVKVRAIVNKYHKSLFSAGLSSSEVKKVLGSDVAGYVNANDSLVREAIDRGVPTTAIKSRNSIMTDVRNIIGV